MQTFNLKSWQNDEFIFLKWEREEGGIKIDKDHKIINDLIFDHFEYYFKEVIIKYNKKELYLTGSIAHYFEREIREVSKKFNINIMQVEKDPIDHLVNYHVK